MILQLINNNAYDTLALIKGDKVVSKWTIGERQSVGDGFVTTTIHEFLDATKDPASIQDWAELNPDGEDIDDVIGDGVVVATIDDSGLYVNEPAVWEDRLAFYGVLDT